jgi:hypothetical protein
MISNCWFRPAKSASGPGEAKTMNGELLAKMIEELVDLKIQHYAESNLKLSPEVARILQAKRETDRRRLEQIRVEIVRVLND